MNPTSIWVAPKTALTRIHIIEENVTNKTVIEKLSETTPLTLAEIIDIALMANPDTKKSWANAREEAAVFGQSLKNYFILATLNGKYDLERRRQYSTRTFQNHIDFYDRDYGAEIDLSYILLDFGQTRYSSKAALEALFSADWSHNSVLQKTMKSVMDDFYNYLLEQQLLKAQEMDLINAEVTLESTQEKFKLGLADVSDVVQATTSYLKQQLDLVSQEQSTHQAYTLIVENMGYSSDAQFVFQNFPKEVLTFTPEKLDSLIEKAVINRPDLLSKESTVKSKEAALKASKLSRLPVVNTSLDLARLYYHEPMVGTGLTKYTTTISLSLPLFQGFYISNAIKKGQSQLTAALSDLKKLRLEIEQEVSNYRVSVILSKKALKYAKAYLESANEDYAVYLDKYRAGTTNIVDLIQAQTAVSDARAKKAKSEQQWYSSVADLTYSLGLLLPSRVSSDQARLKLGESESEKAY